jgi:hypothetical protein
MSVRRDNLTNEATRVKTDHNDEGMTRRGRVVFEPTGACFLQKDAPYDRKKEKES